MKIATPTGIDDPPSAPPPAIPAVEERDTELDHVSG